MIFLLILLKWVYCVWNERKSIEGNLLDRKCETIHIAQDPNSKQRVGVNLTTLRKTKVAPADFS